MTALFGDDAKKLVVGLHNETLDQFAFFRRHRPCAVEDVLKLTAFKNDRSEPDFIEQLLVIEGLDDDADAAGDGGLVRH